MKKNATVFFCQECGYESANGWDSVRHVMNGTPLRKSRKLLPPEEGAQGEVPEKKEGKNLFY